MTNEVHCLNILLYYQQSRLFRFTRNDKDSIMSLRGPRVLGGRGNLKSCDTNNIYQEI